MASRRWPALALPLALVALAAVAMIGVIVYLSLRVAKGSEDRKSQDRNTTTPVFVATVAGYAPGSPITQYNKMQFALVGNQAPETTPLIEEEVNSVVADVLGSNRTLLDATPEERGRIAAAWFPNVPLDNVYKALHKNYGSASGLEKFYAMYAGTYDLIPPPRPARMTGPEVFAAIEGGVPKDVTALESVDGQMLLAAWFPEGRYTRAQLLAAFFTAAGSPGVW